MNIDISSLSLYKWRYWIGYGLVGIMLVILLLAVGLYSPGALSNDEIQSLQTTSQLRATNLASIDVVDLPYRALQHLSLSLFGVSQFSIKLPSLFLGLLSAIGMILLLRLWFRRNIAVITSFIAITNSHFLFLAQSGTPAILHLFWPVWILLTATLIARRYPHSYRNKIILFILAALSLYTPLAIYTLLAISLTALLHPHFRHIIKNLRKSRLSVSLVVSLVVLTPLFIGFIKNPISVLTILGLPHSMPDIPANLSKLFNLYFGFYSSIQSDLLSPIFGMGVASIIAIGFYKLFKTRANTHSYLIHIWILLLTPIIILNPTNTAVILAPTMLLIAAGLDSLVYYWYNTFPRNPYARVAGMVPIIALVMMLTASGLERYLYSYQYNPELKSHFSEDLSLLKNKDIQLIVDESETKFYETVADYEKELDVTNKPTAEEVVYTKKANAHASNQYSLVKIMSSPRAENSDRFYVYKKNKS